MNGHGVTTGGRYEIEANPKFATSTRTCFFCGAVLSAHASFIETVSQPEGERRDFCSWEHLARHLTEPNF